MDKPDKNVPIASTRNKKYWCNIRRLRLSLKYRPEILKLILKMRQCIREKNILLKKLKHQLKFAEERKHLQALTNKDQCNRNYSHGIPLKSSDNLERDGPFNATESEINLPKKVNSVSTEDNLVANSTNKEPVLFDRSTSFEHSIIGSFSEIKTEIDASVHTVKDNSLISSDDKECSLDKEVIGFDTTIKHYEDVKENQPIDTHTEARKMNVIETFTKTEFSIEDSKAIDINVYKLDNGNLNMKDNFTQTESTDHFHYINKSLVNDEVNKDSEQKPLGWTSNDNGDEEKSIAEQVKEVAQSAMQQSGMVYVESAGMYYDYKTGYYYNSELGLYYHTDTGCYYYYSDEQKTFAFHSYPERSTIVQNRPPKPIRKSKINKKAKKSDDIENLTKNFSQDEDNADASSPKRRRLTKHKKQNKRPIKSDINKKEIKSGNENENIDELKECKENDVKVENENDSKPVEELEDGECSDSSDEKSDSVIDESDASTATASDDESVAKHHPPCMRVTVRETNLPKLKVGSLFLVTKDGGTVGREGEHHAILLKDYNVSRNHLDIKFNADKRMYTAVDLGSKNGTILNGVRMSESQEVSDPMEVLHGSTLQLGETKLLCHIHAGNDTCGHCEPGLIMEAEEKEKKVAYTRTCSVQMQHQLELARLKNKYAPKPLQITDTEYNDRAQARREKVGSSHHSEKTQSSDLDTAIAADNKGFKLLEKMGWSKGEGLGKDSQGDTEPFEKSTEISD